MAPRFRTTRAFWTARGPDKVVASFLAARTRTIVRYKRVLFSRPSVALLNPAPPTDVSGYVPMPADPEHSMRRYACEYCHKTFTHSRFLSKHKNNYCYFNPRSMYYKTKTTRPYICIVCGASYSKQSSLRSHVRFDCGKTQKCDRCEKTFLHSSSLRKHKLQSVCREESHRGPLYLSIPTDSFKRHD
ncbi:hypothetical protein KM043_007633 [Ampulex compressa]|nr:hypothetical protein KM043_007633 [Ampulex compressa]